MTNRTTPNSKTKAKPRKRNTSKEAAAKIAAPLPAPKRPWHHRVHDTIRKILEVE